MTPIKAHPFKASLDIDLVISVEGDNDPNRFKSVNNIVLSLEEVEEDPNPLIGMEKKYCSCR